MRKAEIEDRERILRYLQDHLADCLYLYIDILNYGIAAENMQVWMEEDGGEITLIVMKYHDSFQVYSHRADADLTAVSELLQIYPVAMISSTRAIIEKLEMQCKTYTAAYGEVFVMTKHRKFQGETKVLRASVEEAEEIARLICSDEEIGGHYSIEDLKAQLAERIATGTGRSYIICDQGQIAAHSATYAEAEGIAVVGGTMIRKEYRKTDYYMLLSNYMLQELAAEGKKAYTFAASEKMICYHRMLHHKCGEYGKLEKR